MLGAIIGDTVGSVYEFDNTKDYHFPLFTGESIYTDDSVMSFAVANWLISDSERTEQGLVDEIVRFANTYRNHSGISFLKCQRRLAIERSFQDMGLKVNPCGNYTDIS